jgi:hypothetical protein
MFRLRILALLLVFPASAIATDGRAQGQDRVAMGAQRAVLYEEDASNPAGLQFAGSVTWRTEPVASASGRTADIAVLADIDIPQRRLQVSWALRRNTEPALLASHTIEISFAHPADFPHGAIGSMPGILTKPAQTARGTPLIGRVVKRGDEVFLLGLSSFEADAQRNIQLMKDGQWIDIPVVYADGRRAILSVEKGPAGADAMAEELGQDERRAAVPARPPVVPPAPMPQIAGAQRAMLYEEDASSPHGLQFDGSVAWRTEGASSGPPGNVAVMADINVPQRRMRVGWALRRNADPALPASHTIEVRITLPADFPHASTANPQNAIANMPGMLLKQKETARGVPLAGLAVKVTSDSFLVGLSNVKTDMLKNLQLIREGKWIDIPLIYSDGKRAILAVEIGPTGTKALADGLAKWEQAD